MSGDPSPINYPRRKQRSTPAGGRNEEGVESDLVGAWHALQNLSISADTNDTMTGNLASENGGRRDYSFSPQDFPPLSVTQSSFFSSWTSTRVAQPIGLSPTFQSQFQIPRFTDQNQNQTNRRLSQSVGLESSFNGTSDQYDYDTHSGQLSHHLNLPIHMEDNIMSPQGTSAFENHLIAAMNTGLHVTQSSRSSQQSPQNFFLYQQRSHHFAYEEGIFYIGGLDPRNLDQNFNISLRNPLGDPCLVSKRLCEATNYPYLICTFHAQQPGIYNASVTVRDIDHPGHFRLTDIKWSPMQILVSRRYGEPSSQSRIIARMTPAADVKFWGICVDHPLGNIYLTDRELTQIHVLNSEGNYLFSFGERGFGPGKFNRPTGIAFDQVNRRLIISDQGNHDIVIYDLSGTFMTSFGRSGESNGEFEHPWGVAVSPDGNLIAVADEHNCRVQLFDKHGRFLKSFRHMIFQPNTSVGPASMYPRGVCFNNTGDTLYVTGHRAQMLISFNIASGQSTVLIGPGILISPQGVAVDAVGNILVCNTLNNSIRVIAPDGVLLSTISESEPIDVTVLPSGRIVFVDNHAMVRLY